MKLVMTLALAMTLAFGNDTEQGETEKK
jgi:hypothetical protein